MSCTARRLPNVFWRRVWCLYKDYLPTEAFNVLSFALNIEQVDRDYLGVYAICGR
jgi:hypothetical protein